MIPNQIQSYLGNPNVKRDGVIQEWTPELLKELNLMPLFLRRYFERKLIKDIEPPREDQINYQKDFNILCVPNIVDICYGRGVGYTFTQHDLGKDIHNISATKIRAEMREQGKL